MKRKLLLWLGIAAGVMVGGIFVLGLFLGQALKKGVSLWGPGMAGVPVELRNASLSLWSGQACVEGFVLGNPEGYKTPHALRVERVRVAVRPTSVFSDKLHIRTLELESPEVTLELGPGGNNLKRILAHLEASTGARGAAGPAGGDSAPERKLQVDRFVLKGATVRLGATALGGSVPVRLPDIVLEDLGTGPEGITGPELARKVMSALVENTAQAAQQAAGALGKEATRAAESLGREAAEAAGKLKRGLGELLKKKE